MSGKRTQALEDAKQQWQEQQQAEWEKKRHRAEVQPCSTCALFEELGVNIDDDGAEQGPRKGECRLNPPQMAFALVPAGPQPTVLAGQQPQPPQMAFAGEHRWTGTQGNGGCAQHKRRGQSMWVPADTGQDEG